MDSLFKKLQAAKDEHWGVRGEFGEAMKEKYAFVVSDLREMGKYFNALEIERYHLIVKTETGGEKQESEFYYAPLSGKLMAIDDETNEPMPITSVSTRQMLFFAENIVNKWDKVKPAIMGDLETQCEELIDQLEAETRQMRAGISFYKGECEELPGDILM